MTSSPWGLCGVIPHACISAATSGSADIAACQGDCSSIMRHTKFHLGVTCTSNRHPYASDARLIGKI